MPELNLFIPNPKIIQNRFHRILSGEAGIPQKAPLILPVLEATVVEHLELIRNYKGNYVMPKTFLEHNQAANTTVSILKGVNGFKANVKIQDIIKSDF